MELYKFISETNIKKYNGGFVVADNRIYTNPKEETIKKAGYKPLANGEVPEFDVQTQYIGVTYKEEDECIVPLYEVKNFEVLENE